MVRTIFTRSGSYSGTGSPLDVSSQVGEASVGRSRSKVGQAHTYTYASVRIKAASVPSTGLAHMSTLSERTHFRSAPGDRARRGRSFPGRSGSGEVHPFQNTVESRVTADEVAPRTESPRLERDVVSFDRFLQTSEAFVEVSELRVDPGNDLSTMGAVRQRLLTPWESQRLRLVPGEGAVLGVDQLLFRRVGCSSSARRNSLSACSRSARGREYSARAE